jgi:hypothetical protein
VAESGEDRQVIARAALFQAVTGRTRHAHESVADQLRENVLLVSGERARDEIVFDIGIERNRSRRFERSNDCQSSSTMLP